MQQFTQEKNHLVRQTVISLYDTKWDKHEFTIEHRIDKKVDYYLEDGLSEKYGSFAIYSAYDILHGPNPIIIDFGNYGDFEREVEKKLLEKMADEIVRQLEKHYSN